VASSDPRLWADIFLTNRRQILKSGRLFERYYRNILSAVSRGDYSATVNALKRAKAKRDKFSYGKERP
jgi:prephenate dehydrogenase